uniref:BPL/LPL catalytic domain-containing protein n=1 Tax=uncultured Elusimicrobia bacterium TaxID=699876 RepID=A0A650ENV6_9BACT|nr:hypothetical protein Elusimicrob2101_1610 [uncultured Elusimicrobia bacterium]
MEERKFPLQSVTKVIGLECVDSTQNVARELAEAGEQHGALVLACHQAKAQGRDKCPFSAGEGGVYFTLILRPNKPASCAVTLGIKAAESVAQTISSVFEIKTKVKQPGDVLAWDAKNRAWKKICGVWAEASAGGDYMLLGVGVHLNDRLPASQKDACVSLKQLIGAETSKELFLDELLENFWKHYAHWTTSMQ